MKPRRPALLGFAAIQILLTILAPFLTGCGHPKQARVNVASATGAVVGRIGCRATFRKHREE